MSANDQSPKASLIGESIDAAFEARVLRDPGSIALTQDGRNVSYGELNQRADALASRLLRNGVTLERTVGIYLDRSIDMMVAVIAVLKAGGAYVPMDPSQPASRLEFIIADSAPAAVITASHLRSRLPASYEHVIFIDADKDAVAAEAPLPDRSRSRKDSLAYVIYTSGSTGTPKGVMVEHGSVIRFIQDIESLVQPSARDTWVLVHSFAFDFSVLELWACLLYGGRLVIPSYETVRTPTAFFELLCTEQATVVSQTPSAFRQLVAAQEMSSRRPSLRTIILGGEAVEMKSVRRWQQIHGDSAARIINMYGPTEATVFVTTKILEAEDAANIGNSSPIGTPIAGASIHILDAHLQPVPDGVVGEIFIAGDGVARGYLNRPQLTAQRFIANPSGAEGKIRMYRTGDRGRQHPDGQLEYLGRTDFQVKIRGFRVELGEIETNLYAHPNVDEAVVIVREDVPGHQRLAAYFTSRGEHSPSSASLRTFLASRLPEHMIPADFVALQNLPLTSNGKINRSALPKPGLATSDLEYHPPQGDIEEALAALWMEMLGVERVGRNDNFFERGGSSMLGMLLIGKVTKRFRINPGIALVFQHPTVRQMAAYIEERMVADASEVDMEEGLL